MSAPCEEHRAAPRTESRRVLVVEDERRLREMLITSIKEMGFDPAGTGSAEAALRAFEQSPPAIAVLDLNLPGMDGMDLGESIHRRWPATQIIILTGFGDLASARRAIRLEAADFLTKPCGMNELEAALVKAQGRWLERWVTQPGANPSPSRRAAASPPPASIPPAGTSGQAASSTKEVLPPAPQSIEEMERRLIQAALARHAGNRDAAAAELGISVRKLYYRIQQYQAKGQLES